MGGRGDKWVHCRSGMEKLRELRLKPQLHLWGQEQGGESKAQGRGDLQDIGWFTNCPTPH